MLTKIKKIVMAKKSKKESKVENAAVDAKIAKLEAVIKKLKARK